MSIPYPANPTNVPSDLCKASPQYRKRAWLAMGGLLLFVIIYLSISFFFAWKSIHFFMSASSGGDNAFLGIIAGIPTAFLAIFLIKALFFIRRGSFDGLMEITAKDEPALFKFINQLADDAKAPRPHKVFLTHDVNASVAHDLTFLNFFFRSKKNLIIGLGLLNSVSLDEFKAVLAHEFGHFAQKSTSVGNYVYIAHQVAGHIVAERGVLDSFLRGLSNFDLRVAWIGWILQLIVWSIRSVLDSVFSIVTLAHRALSREMEFQADLVSVSLSGSDSLIHGLHRLQAADDSWNRALQFTHSQLVKKNGVEDIFKVQSQVVKNVSVVLSEPFYGKTEEVPVNEPENHRVIKKSFAQPPQMWSTHPDNSDREENAKRRYIPSVLDERSPWILFKDPEKVKHKATKDLIQLMSADELKVEKKLSDEESIKLLNEEYSLPYFNTKYRGAYLGRSITRYAESVEELIDPNMKFKNIKEQIVRLYPSKLTDVLQQYRGLDEEVGLLEALKDKFLTAPGGVIQFRGEEISRQELPKVIKKVKVELDEVQEVLERRDKICRSIHYVAASDMPGWQKRLKSILKVHHYADHTLENLNDAMGLLNNTLAVVFADNRVTNKELQRVLVDANGIHKILKALNDQKVNVRLDDEVLKKCEIESWSGLFKDFDLPRADEGNINEWMQVIESWAGYFSSHLTALRTSALELLLESEEKVKRAYVNDEVLPDAPEPLVVPQNYTRLLPGDEREIQKKLGPWDRFATADGLIPGLTRFTVAASIIIAVVVATYLTGSTTVTAYNALGQSMVVELNGSSKTIRPNNSKEFSVPVTDVINIRTETKDGRLVESFNESVGGSFSSYVYNIGRASPLIQWTAVYGNARQRPERNLKNPRWMSTSVEYLFTDPPNSVSTKGGGATRQAISGMGGESPLHMLHLVENPRAQYEMALSHFKWDPSNSENFMIWAQIASLSPNFKETLNEKLKDDPFNVICLRLEKDTAKDGEKSAIIAKHKQLGKDHPDKPEMQYIAIRAIEDEKTRDEAFLSAAKNWPKDPWLANAAGYTFEERHEWDKALVLYTVAFKNLKTMQRRLAVRITRLQKMSGRSSGISNSELEKASDDLKYYNSLTNNREVRKSPLRVYSKIASNRLSEAETIIRSSKDYNGAYVLMAASDGAKANWVSRAVGFSPDSLDDASLAYAIALTLEKGKSISKYMKKFEEITNKKAQKIIDFVKSDSLDYVNELKGVDSKWVAMSLAMKKIAKPKRYPSEWKSIINKVLFLSERPYFKY